jgi:hypothetical protein
MSGSQFRVLLTSAVAVAIAAACGPAEGVAVRELPPLERPSPEARAGLIDVHGSWNLAGWEVVDPAVGEVLPERAPRSVRVEEQRLDSLSGQLVGAEASRGFVGEIRRDGIVSLVVGHDDGNPAVVAGAVSRDTLWLELSTAGGFAIPAGGRAAYIRAPTGQTWVRLPNGALLRDTVIAVAGETAVSAPSPPPPSPPVQQPGAAPAASDNAPTPRRDGPAPAPVDTPGGQRPPTAQPPPPPETVPEGTVPADSS